MPVKPARWMTGRHDRRSKWVIRSACPADEERPRYRRLVSSGDGSAPGDQLWRLLRGPLASWALFTVVDLAIADELAARGPTPVEELARNTGADADVLNRLLRTLATEGVFAEREPRTFANTASSELLCRGASPWCDAFVVYGSVYRALAELPRAARTREPMFETVAGIDWWKFLERNPALGETFNRLMQGGAQDRVGLIADLEWRDGDTVVDVGAGNGTLLIELLQRQPGLRGVAFDLPEVAREAEQRIDAADLSERCRVVAGNFFDGVPPGGDAYVLAKVLHDWDDAPAAHILGNIRAAAPAHARILVIDAVVSPGNEPDDAKWTDIVMLALVNGRERSEHEWRSLLASTGFEVERVSEELVEATPATLGTAE